MRKLSLTVLVVLISLTSCKKKIKEKEWSDLPGVIGLDSLKQTDFVATLENPIVENSNTIYAPALLYAWDTIRNILNGEILLTETNSTELKWLTQSTSFKNSLTNDEYTVEAIVEGRRITAKAFFNKTLPFATKLQKADGMMDFDKQKVKAFGMYYFDEDAVAFSDILYYSNDDNFILKLTPKDSLHEIILVKGLNKMSSLSEAVNKTNELISLGRNQKTNTSLSENYKFNEDDIYSIPEVNFNIETNYKNLEGQLFFVGANEKVIETAYQRTGFIFNETGAVVESETVVAVSDTTIASLPVAKPKRLIFDKPFYIIIKRVDATNPYFVMRVANAELLRKE